MLKYTHTIEIDLPLDQVVALWTDENLFSHWQDGFIEIDHLKGVPGADGSQSKIIFMRSNKEMELMETVLKNNLPHEKVARYVHTHMTNIQTTRFESIDKGRTAYTSQVEYTEFNSFMPKIMAKFFPGIFRNQSLKWMEQFKKFAEKRSNE